MKRNVRFVLITLVLCLATAAHAQQQTSADIDQRVEKILGQMTLEEKIDYIGGTKDFYVRAIPRLGVPELKMSDGPLGIRNFGPSTAYPAGIAMAATWDVDLAKQVGTMMGKDSRARGIHFLLGPGMNIYRAPMCGRNFEYFGEDPFLASRMAVANIIGIQSQGVIATAKHYMGNNQEWNRHHISSDIDERTMREIYLPAFEASVKEAKVGAFMDAYNLVNGVHMTQHGSLNTDVLRKEWGFDGIMMSDWDSTYDGVAAANGGLDLEMPSGKFMNRETLIAAVIAGTVKTEVIDEKVRRILRTAMAFGFFDRDQIDGTIPLTNPESTKASLQAAREGIVLLKNDGVLPLDAKKLKRVAVIGPNADMAIWGGGGSSRVEPYSGVTILSGIRTAAGAGVDVAFSPGLQLTRDIFEGTEFSAADGMSKGLTAEYFNNTELKGEPVLVRTDGRVAFDWKRGSYDSGSPEDNFSVRWTGYYTAPHNGTFGIYVAGDDGFRLYVDDKPVIDQWVYQGETLLTKTIELEGGRKYKVRLEYFEGTGDSKIGFGISDGLGNSELQNAKEVAAKADAVILTIGFNATSEGEGADRPFELSHAQQALVKEVMSANKNVIAVISAGGNIDMADWLGGTRALLHTWYAGEQVGTALAEVLFGVTNPSGKLPVSFERAWKDNPTSDSYYDPDGDKRVQYKEGIFLGYRHYDRSTVKPLFPFGYGLSYTKYKYSKLKIGRPAKDGTVKVTYKVANVGSREGAEVSQVYVSEKQATVPRPVKELKGFARTPLKPGESKKVSVTLDRRAFAYYDTETKQWTVNPGEFEVLVGSSSQQIEAKGTVKVGQ